MTEKQAISLRCTSTKTDDLPLPTCWLHNDPPCKNSHIRHRSCSWHSCPLAGGAWSHFAWVGSCHFALSPSFWPKNVQLSITLQPSWTNYSKTSASPPSKGSTEWVLSCSSLKVTSPRIAALVAAPGDKISTCGRAVAGGNVTWGQKVAFLLIVVNFLMHRRSIMWLPRVNLRIAYTKGLWEQES